MPPQPGVFSVPYGMGHKSRSTAAYAGDVEMGQAYQHHPIAGSSRVHGKVFSGHPILHESEPDHPRRRQQEGEKAKGPVREARERDE